MDDFLLPAVAVRLRRAYENWFAVDITRLTLIDIDGEEIQSTLSNLLKDGTINLAIVVRTMKRRQQRK